VQPRREPALRRITTAQPRAAAQDATARARLGSDASVQTMDGSPVDGVGGDDSAPTDTAVGLAGGDGSSRGSSTASALSVGDSAVQTPSLSSTVFTTPAPSRAVPSSGHVGSRGAADAPDAEVSFQPSSAGGGRSGSSGGGLATALPPLAATPTTGPRSRSATSAATHPVVGTVDNARDGAAIGGGGGRGGSAGAAAAADAAAADVSQALDNAASNMFSMPDPRLFEDVRRVGLLELFPHADDALVARADREAKQSTGGDSTSGDATTSNDRGDGDMSVGGGGRLRQHTDSVDSTSSGGVPRSRSNTVHSTGSAQGASNTHRLKLLGHRVATTPGAGAGAGVAGAGTGTPRTPPPRRRPSVETPLRTAESKSSAHRAADGGEASTESGSGAGVPASRSPSGVAPPPPPPAAAATATGTPDTRRRAPVAPIRVPDTDSRHSSTGGSALGGESGAKALPRAVSWGADVIDTQVDDDSDHNSPRRRRRGVLNGEPSGGAKPERGARRRQHKVSVFDVLEDCVTARELQLRDRPLEAHFYVRKRMATVQVRV